MRRRRRRTPVREAAVDVDRTDRLVAFWIHAISCGPPTVLAPDVVDEEPGRAIGEALDRSEEETDNLDAVRAAYEQGLRVTGSSRASSTAGRASRSQSRGQA